jgi:hypothetical protein
MSLMGQEIQYMSLNNTWTSNKLNAHGASMEPNDCAWEYAETEFHSQS